MQQDGQDRLRQQDRSISHPAGAADPAAYELVSCYLFQKTSVKIQ